MSEPGEFVDILSVVALAADVSGRWTGKVPEQKGAFETTFEFRVEGDKLSGTADGVKGVQPGVNGKLAGGTISFTIEDAESGNQLFEGKIPGDEIRFTRTGRRGEPRPFTAKRVK